MIRFYKYGETFGIDTDCTTLDDLTSQMAYAICRINDTKRYASCMDRQLAGWLPLYAELMQQLKKGDGVTPLLQAGTFHANDMAWIMTNEYLLFTIADVHVPD